AAPAPPEPTWPADYPRELRARKWEEAVTVLGLRPDRLEEPDFGGARAPRQFQQPAQDPLYQPLWCRRLFGTGLYYTENIELRLTERPTRGTGKCTLLCLDDDLHRRWFEFTAELPQHINDPLSNPRGVFFGWQQEGAEKARAYFAQLDLTLNPGQNRPH